MNTIYLEPWKPRLIIRPNRVSSLVSAGGSACIPGKLWVAVPWHRARALTPRSRVKDFRPPARGVLCPSACQTLGAEDNRHRRAIRAAHFSRPTLNHAQPTP